MKTVKTMKCEVTFSTYANSPCEGLYQGNAEIFGITIVEISGCHSEKELVNKLVKEVRRINGRQS